MKYQNRRTYNYLAANSLVWGFAQARPNNNNNTMYMNIIVLLVPVMLNFQLSISFCGNDHQYNNKQPICNYLLHA